MVNHEIDESNKTIAVLIARRVANVHYRYGYHYVVSDLGAAYRRDTQLINFLNRFVTYDRDFDPILDRKYSRSWVEAATIVKQHEAEHDEKTRRDEADL